MSAPSPAPRACFSLLRPALDEILQALSLAPLDSEQRSALSLMVAGFFFGAAMAALDAHCRPGGGQPGSATAREVADLLVALLERGEQVAPLS